MLFSGAALLSSCSDSDSTTQLSIQKDCNEAQNQCSVELVNETIVRSTNMLGKTNKKVTGSTPVPVGSDFEWVINGNGALATSADLDDNDLPKCVAATCTLKDNPSGFTFNIATTNNNIAKPIKFYSIVNSKQLL